MLQAQGVRKSFGGLLVLDDCSFACEAGTITGLVGPNGSGKSTLFNTLTGIVRPEAGEIFFDGRKVTNRRPHEIARLGVARTFQTTRLFGSLTVLDNVLLGRTSSGDEAAAAGQAMSLLERFGIPQLAQRTADALSFGQQRLVELARAMMNPPRVILLDEPFAGLSPLMAVELERHLVRLPAEGVGLVLVEHDLTTVMKLCTRVVVLNRGRTIADGEPEAVRSDPGVIASYLGEA